MTEETRKGLDEAAKQYCKDFGRTGEVNGFDVTAFKHGAEFGYKEAIAQVKAWLGEHIPSIITETEDYVTSFELHMIPMSKFLADFEADMNKLWEGEK